MAAISINVNSEGKWTVTLDRFEWTALEVDNQTVRKVDNEWTYTQPTSGNMQFKATAVGTQYLNPGQTWVEECNGLYYMLTLDYVAKPNGFDIYGYGIILHNWGGELTPSPHGFNQGKMTGSYTVTCD
ncbi:MAG: hypothetical protein AAF617_07690 [Bacteroidota bacterium]